MKRNFDSLKSFLNEKVLRYNQPGFIENDPIQIPHLFSKQQDIEIAGLFAALLAWGQRKTIINKCKELLQRMDNEPYDFIIHHTATDLKRLEGFVHRTFNDTDLLYFIHFLHTYFKKHQSLEDLFVHEEGSIRSGIIHFNELFFSLPHAPHRTRKHVPDPRKGSACKRMNMYLRWMVRSDDKGVDFGIWKKLSARNLICPCDVHVERVARKLKLIRRKQVDWQTAEELTAALRMFDADDPVKYDFALFGLGVEEKY
ncbi:MAG TPA: TIGR02757 family protein [Cyclobacteriaceae bacterium]|nr:TIGR02757 family protein [Cyclobacteriaceae bacterium]